MASGRAAAAESDVAGLLSEATATFGVEWLTPPLQHSDTNESSPAKTSHFVRRPARPTMKALRGFCRASLADNVRGRGGAQALSVTTCWPRARSS